MADAIDFRALRRQERRRVNGGKEKKADPNPSKQRSTHPPWHAPDEEDWIPPPLQLESIVEEPPFVRYQPDYLPPNWQKALWDWLHCYETRDDDGTEPTSACWTRLKYAQRRVLVLSSGDFPPPIQLLVDALSPLFTPNHVLINAYPPGSGILPHTDGPAYEPQTATLSLGCPAQFAIDDRLFWTLAPGSWVVFGDEWYRGKHSIAPVEVERISLTFRVKK